MKRCSYCGRTARSASSLGSVTCSPPFEVKPHSFVEDPSDGEIYAAASFDSPEERQEFLRKLRGRLPMFESMRDLDLAPRDGTRILIRHWPYHYGHPPGVPHYRRLRSFQDWHRTPEPKWEEVRWIDKEEQTGSKPHWEEWTGDPNCSSSNHIHDADVIGWLPLPEESD